MDILIEQELALHRHEIRQNLTEVSRLMSPSFREVGESGTSYDFQSIIKMMNEEESSTGYIHAQDFEGSVAKNSAKAQNSFFPI